MRSILIYCWFTAPPNLSNSKILVKQTNDSESEFEAGSARDTIVKFQVIDNSRSLIIKPHQRNFRRLYTVNHRYNESNESRRQICYCERFATAKSAFQLYIFVYDFAIKLHSN